jgi:hypothetical protein
MLSVIRKTLVVAALLLFVGASARAEFGKTPGEFGVSGGSASYTIPIWTPPGPNGLTPSISLHYSSSR